MLKIVENFWAVGVPPRTPMAHRAPPDPLLWASSSKEPRCLPSASILGTSGLIWQFPQVFLIQCLRVLIKHWQLAKRGSRMESGCRNGDMSNLVIQAAEMTVLYVGLKVLHTKTDCDRYAALCRKVHVCHCNSLGGAT